MSTNQLTKIVLNEKLEKLICFNNQLIEIVLNSNLKYLDCSDNNLTEIICNSNLKMLYCWDNPLEINKINEKLIELLKNEDCDWNKKIIKKYYQRQTIIKLLKDRKNVS